MVWGKFGGEVWGKFSKKNIFMEDKSIWEKKSYGKIILYGRTND